MPEIALNITERGARVVLPGGDEWTPGEPLPHRTLVAASLLFSQLRDVWDEGSSTFPDGRITSGHKLLARVSYNGCVWPPEPWTPGATPLLNPFKKG